MNSDEGKKTYVGVGDALKLVIRLIWLWSIPDAVWNRTMKRDQTITCHKNHSCRSAVSLSVSSDALSQFVVSSIFGSRIYMDDVDLRK